MAVMDLSPENDPILRTPTEPFDFENPQCDPMQLAQDLMESMEHYNGYGISANQLGLPYSVFAMRAPDNYIVAFNPRIVNLSGDDVYMLEGCLSFPGLAVKIKRPAHARFRFQTPSGHTETMQFTGLSARVVQHEIDHLNGIVFFERATLFHREQAFRKRKKAIYK